VLAPVRHDFVQSIGQPLADAATAHIDGSFADQAAAGRRLLEEDGVPLAEIVVRHEADLLFRGQSHVFRVPVTAPGFDPWPTTTPLTSLRHVQFPGAHSKIHRWLPIDISWLQRRRDAGRQAEDPPRRSQV
jgi:N-methylhydantoinase A/oxoprolinase/acetone carboxylase beta subunit